MGKASKWIVNFLLGKREDKDKRKDITFFEENVATPTSSAPPTPTHKRRWNFRKPENKLRTSSNRPKSFDSFTTIIAHRPLLKYDTQQDYTRALVVANTTKQSTYAPLSIKKAVADIAATRIQAVFRAYLARKALCALRGLVKIQALVRGHLVRKQTTASLIRMHALITIQVRARMQRLQMAEESQSQPQKSQSSRHKIIYLDNGFKAAHSETSDFLSEGSEVLKHINGHLNQSHSDRVTKGAKKSYSGELPILKRKHQLEEFTVNAAQNSPKTDSTIPRVVPGRASFTCEKPEYLHPISHQFPFVPKYMITTESSKAKVRSQSQPKERPKWNMRRRSKKTASAEGLDMQQDAQTHCLSPQMTCTAHENSDPWFINLYHPNNEANNRASTNQSHCSKLLVTHEVNY